MTRYSVALEQQNDTARWLASHRGMNYVKGFCSNYEQIVLGKPSFGMAERARARAFYAACVHVTTHGEPYYWSPEMCSLLETAGAKLPEWRLEQEVIPTEAGYMWFDRPLAMTIAPLVMQNDGLDAGYHPTPAELQRINETPEPLCAMGWTWLYDRDVPTLRIISFVQDNISQRLGGVPTTIAEWSVGETITDVWVNQIGVAVERGTPEGRVFDSEEWEQRYLEVLRYFGAAMLLLNQHVFVAQREKPDRLARKRVARPQDIHVLYLRRALNRQRAGASQCEIDWQYQWFVSGHYRWLQCDLCRAMRLSCTHQKNSIVRRPTWIGGYTKGPTDKPLKDPTIALRAMVR